MIVLNAILCGWISYVAFAFMAHRHPPKLFRDMVMQGGLAVIFALALAAAIMPFPTDHEPQWWTVGLRFGGFIVASALYDMEFGIVRHLRMLRTWFATLPRRVWPW